MRTLTRNKQTLYFANQIGLEPVYERDEDGNIKYIEVDGELVPIETGDKEMVYTKPQEIKANIALSGGEVNIVEFGVDSSNYDAVLIVNKDEPILSETSLIWHKSKLVYKDMAKTQIDANSADYRVSRVSPSINVSKYLLQKVVKSNG